MEAWVDQAAQLTKPDRIVFCDGSEAENQAVLHEMLKHSDSFQLNPQNLSQLLSAPQQPQ